MGRIYSQPVQITTGKSYCWGFFFFFSEKLFFCTVIVFFYVSRFYTSRRWRQIGLDDLSISD